MQIQCVHCGKQYSLRDENVGSQFLCRSCKKLSPVPVRAPEESAVVSPLAPIAARPAEPAAGPIETECQHCGKQYKLKSAAAGMQFKCKQCGGLTPVGAPAPLPPPQPIKAASPSPPLAAQPARRVLGAIPQKARPATAAPLAARPAARLARPSSAPPQAMPAGPAEAEFVAVPVGSSDAPSPFGYPTDARPPAPPVRKAKPKRSSGGSFDGEKMGRVLGGIFFMVLGVGLVALGVYGYQNGYRRPGRAISGGIGVIILGFMMVIGRHHHD